MTSGEKKAETMVKCPKCGTMNSLKLRAVDEEARIKAEKLYPRRV
jgi:phage FluMu protein Com